jgi:N-acetylglutamate synthase-like GNAT family acetyltransferase
MMQSIQVREFTEGDIPAVYSLLQNTIETSYREVYPPEAIELFKDHHSEEQILTDAAGGYMVVAEYNGEILGTGTLSGSNMRRVYINPPHQHRGIGKLITQELEKKALDEKLTTIDLAASLVSKRFWESRGYTVQKEDYVPVKNNKKLHFYRMSKTLQ